MTKNFRVNWEIDIMADSHEEAVDKALMIQRNPFSDATFFTAVDSETGEKETLDAENHSALNCNMPDDEPVFAET